MEFTIFDEMVSLAPAGWVPDPRLTGGNFPPQQILITRFFWVSLGRPSSIEEYQEKLAELPRQNTADFRGFPVEQDRAEVPI
jgi:hypothetical protein